MRDNHYMRACTFINVLYCYHDWLGGICPGFRRADLSTGAGHVEESVTKRPALLALLATLVNTAGAGDGQWQTLSYSTNVPGIHSNRCAVLPYEGQLEQFSAQHGVFLPAAAQPGLPAPAVTTGQHWSGIWAASPAVAIRRYCASSSIHGRPTGIPQYLLDGGLRTWELQQLRQQRQSLLPDWNDPKLVQALTSFISAWRARYDGDARIGFITAGLYGFWGEWHTYPLTKRRNEHETNRSKLMVPISRPSRKPRFSCARAGFSNATLLRQFGLSR